MGCPFLSEVRVRTCRVAPLRRAITSPSTFQPDEKCNTARHAECPAFQQSGDTPGAVCPHRDEKLVQYCSASAVPHYVPYSAAESTRCGSESYRFCEAYLAMANTRRNQATVADGVTVPDHLYFSPNHLWLSVGESGLCHVGIDALLARFLGPLDRVSFLTLKGVQRPTAVVTVRGVDWPLVFPNLMLVESADLRLRADPSRISQDPYGAGWLFSGWEAPGSRKDALRANLIGGPRAVAWMKQEANRLVEHVGATASQGELAGDGGCLVDSVAHLLAREELLGLMNEFFSPQSLWSKER